MKLVPFFGLLVLLVACTATEPVAPTRVESTQRAATYDGFTSGLNAIRASAGSRPITSDPLLQAAAQAHATDMQRRNYFAHRSPSGGNGGSRIAATGYRACAWAENIASGRTDALAVLEDWRRSPGHRRNIERDSYSEFGLASAGKLWVIVLARPC